MVLLYSTRLRRCAVTRPGSPVGLSSTLITAATSAVEGLGAGGGGIRPLVILSTTFAHNAGSLRFSSSATPPVLSLLLWQPTQCFARKGRTVLSNSPWVVCAQLV